MKLSILFSFFFLSLNAFSQSDDVAAREAIALVDKQIEAYNKHDAVAFAATYSDTTELYSFPATLRKRFEGIDELKAFYSNAFADNPKLHCEVVAKLALGSTAVYQELVTGWADGRTVKSIATYKIKNGKINKVYFDRLK